MRYNCGMKHASFRLPEKSLSDLRRLAKALNMTLTQVIIVAIDRMAREEKRKK